MEITLNWLKKYFYKNLENYAISNRDYYDENGGKKAINAAFKDLPLERCGKSILM